MSFFLWGEIVFNIEEFSGFLDGLSFDERSNLGTGEFEKRFDIHEVGSKNQFKEYLLFEVYEVGEPFTNDVTKLIASKWLLDLWSRVGMDVSAVLDDLIENSLLD